MTNYNVTWTTPSQSARDSMPLGNGDIALNAWVKDNSDLIFYIAKIDSWDENSRLVKVGKVRIALNPQPLVTSFEQTLNLNDGSMQVNLGENLHLQLWVDANHPVIVVEVDSKHPIEASAAIEMWRTEQTTLPSIEISDIMYDHSIPGNQREPTIVEPDVVLTGQGNRIGWYHHNTRSLGPALMSKLQGLDGFKRDDPIIHRTFGVVIQAENGVKVDEFHLQSPATKTHRFEITVLTQHPSTPEQWLKAIDASIVAINAIPVDQRRNAHNQWWGDFWNRSWIHITGNEAFAVSQSYALQRYVNACAGRGVYPIKFNGSLFTVPYPGKPNDGDYRRWGSGYWWQNTRLPYISMCASGDFDLMQPLFKMYGHDLRELFKYRTQHYLGHDGIYIPECIYFWGDVFSESYGWTPFEEREDKLQESGWHKWEWVSGPELVFMMFDYYDFTQDETFLRETLMPNAHEILTFFDQHYQTNESGKLVMHPSQALETWWECTNPMPEIAGVRAVVERLHGLPESLTSNEQRTFWKSLEAKMPDLPTREIDGKRALAPAESFADKRNVENAELYAVFPFRLIAFDKPNIEWGITALEHRDDPGHFGWRQDDIFMAYLGLTDQAKEGLLARVRNSKEDKFAPPNKVVNDSRFPAFWGPNYDWIPDQDHGGVLLKTVQALLLQTDGRQIHLFPAWPHNWDVDFKLHAPFNTTLEGRFENGRLAELVVTPESRRADVINCLE